MSTTFFTLLYTLIYNFETSAFPTNAILYLVAVIALLCRLASSVKKLNLTPETNKTAFIAYKFVFSAIFLECLALVICVDGFKIQLGILTWIIYMSALMILFMVFLTLTLDEYSHKPDSQINASPNPTSNTDIKYENYFNTFMYVFFFIVFIVLSDELVRNIVKSEQICALSIQYLGLQPTIVIASHVHSVSDVFHSISKDISSSHMEYLLSGLLQASALISVILLVVFK